MHPRSLGASILSGFATLLRHACRSVGGVKVSIVAFQAIDPGSIPG